MESDNKSSKNKKDSKSKSIKNEIIVNPDLEEAVLNQSQRLARGRIFKRFKDRIALARKRSARKMASTEKLMKRARKKAVELIKTKVAGDRGKKYADLSVSEKIQIDKLVEKRKAAIEKLAIRLLPKVKAAEVERLRKHNASVNEQFSQLIDKSNIFNVVDSIYEEMEIS